ncbi:MAG: hypothetical protein ACK40D_08820 [Cyanobacteriota bacterium]|jgi:hypothetical protein
MTVAPSSHPNGTSHSTAEAASTSQPGYSSPSEPGWLGADLWQRVEQAASAQGMTVAAVCEQWVKEGLDRFEAQRLSEDPDGSGRCSLRTGTCSIGPVPLPVQQ